MDDVFSSKKPETDDAGRVVVVSHAWLSIRLRSFPVWVGCHWVQEHVLCGGPKCPLCRHGHPKRPSSFAFVDRVAATTALIRLSATDLAAMSASAGHVNGDLVLGDCWKIARLKERQALSVQFIKHSPEIIELTQDRVMLDVLRLHRIQASARDIAERTFMGLVLARAEEACSGQRTMLQL